MGCSVLATVPPSGPSRGAEEAESPEGSGPQPNKQLSLYLYIMQDLLCLTGFGPRRESPLLTAVEPP